MKNMNWEGRDEGREGEKERRKEGRRRDGRVAEVRDLSFV